MLKVKKTSFASIWVNWKYYRVNLSCIFVIYGVWKKCSSVGNGRAQSLKCLNQSRVGSSKSSSKYQSEVIVKRHLVDRSMNSRRRWATRLKQQPTVFYITKECNFWTRVAWKQWVPFYLSANVLQNHKISQNRITNASSTTLKHFQNQFHKHI